MKTAVFISGRGSNLKALIDHQQDTDVAYEITCVVPDKPDASGSPIPEPAIFLSVSLSAAIFTTGSQTISNQLMADQIELIALAGYMHHR